VLPGFTRGTLLLAAEAAGQHTWALRKEPKEILTGGNG